WPACRPYAHKQLPARLTRLTRMASVVIATPTTAATTKPLPATFWTVRFGLSLVDGQRTPTQISSVQCRNCFIRFTGVCHLHECKTTRSPCLPVRHYADLVDRAMRFESAPQF